MSEAEVLEAEIRAGGACCGRDRRDAATDWRARQPLWCCARARDASLPGWERRRFFLPAMTCAPIALPTERDEPSAEPLATRYAPEPLALICALEPAQ